MASNPSDTVTSNYFPNLEVPALIQSVHNEYKESSFKCIEFESIDLSSLSVRKLSFLFGKCPPNHLTKLIPVTAKFYDCLLNTENHLWMYASCSTKLGGRLLTDILPKLTLEEEQVLWVLFSMDFDRVFKRTVLSVDVKVLLRQLHEETEHEIVRNMILIDSQEIIFQPLRSEDIGYIFYKLSPLAGERFILLIAEIFRTSFSNFLLDCLVEINFEISFLDTLPYFKGNSALLETMIFHPEYDMFNVLGLSINHTGLPEMVLECLVNKFHHISAENLIALSPNSSLFNQLFNRIEDLLYNVNLLHPNQDFLRKSIMTFYRWMDEKILSPDKYFDFVQSIIDFLLKSNLRTVDFVLRVILFYPNSKNASNLHLLPGQAAIIKNFINELVNSNIRKRESYSSTIIVIVANGMSDIVKVTENFNPKVKSIEEDVFFVEREQWLFPKLSGHFKFLPSLYNKKYSQMISDYVFGKNVSNSSSLGLYTILKINSLIQQDAKDSNVLSFWLLQIKELPEHLGMRVGVIIVLGLIKDDWHFEGISRHLRSIVYGLFDDFDTVCDFFQYMEYPTSIFHSVQESASAIARAFLYTKTIPAHFFYQFLCQRLESHDSSKYIIHLDLYQPSWIHFILGAYKPILSQLDFCKLIYWILKGIPLAKTADLKSDLDFLPLILQVYEDDVSLIAGEALHITNLTSKLKHICNVLAMRTDKAFTLKELQSISSDARYFDEFGINVGINVDEDASPVMVSFRSSDEQEFEVSIDLLTQLEGSIFDPIVFKNDNVHYVIHLPVKGDVVQVLVEYLLHVKSASTEPFSSLPSNESLLEILLLADILDL